MDEDPITDSVVANDFAATTMEEDRAHNDEADDHIHPTPDSQKTTWPGSLR